MENLSTLDSAVKSRVMSWLDGNYDESAKNEIRLLLKTNPKALNDSFGEPLSFGTAGLRDILGIGTSRINKYTVRQATQGLANYLKKQFPNTTSRVFIGYDNRRMSKELAEETARTLAANGIEAYITKELRPTPFVSFGCRHFKCQAAVMITASHNPPEYNGYKVYWADGAQIVPPHDKGIIAEVNAIQDPGSITVADLKNSLIHVVDEKADESYLKAIKPLQLNPSLCKHKGSTLSIVYTPLHGAGITLVPKALKEWGFTQIHLVPNQSTPDPEFPTTKSPNPETKEALTLGLKCAQENDADIVIATDPDADRLGVAVKHKGSYVLLSGNDIAVIVADFLLSALSKTGRMPSKPALITTIVSTDLLHLIAKNYHVTSFNVLTGFKYIGELIHKWEQTSDGYSFVFGAEESYGYLVGTHSRDKDAVILSAIVAEIALQAKEEGKSLVDYLYALYAKYGMFYNSQKSINFSSGSQGQKEIKALMQRLRSHPPKVLCGKQVLEIEDYLSLTKNNLAHNTRVDLTLPKSDVLVLRLDDGYKLIIRPSGTEPKVKIYGSIHLSIEGDIEDCLHLAQSKLSSILIAAEQELKS